MKERERDPRTEDRKQRTEDGGLRTAKSRRAAVREALAAAHGGCPFACGRHAAGHGPRDTSHDIRGTGRESRPCAACCRNCVYAVPLQDGARELLVCTGCPLCPGKMRVTEELQCCRSFERRREQTGRTIPPEPPDESIRYIPLTKGKYAIVDTADYERVARYRWCVSGTRRRAYACCCMNGKTISLHRFLTNAPKGMVVDHIDGNGLNNRQGNLRVCTQRQNIYNSRPRGKASRFKGVGWDKRHNKWVAGIRYYGKNIYLGLFQDEAEAARAYDRKAYALFGEYAYLNFPEEIRGVAGR